MTDTYTCQLRSTPLKSSLQRSQGDLSQRLARIQTDLQNHPQSHFQQGRKLLHSFGRDCPDYWQLLRPGHLLPN